MKVSLNSRGLQGMFVQHVEKLVFGVMALAVGWGVYSFASHETFPQTPEELAAKSDAAQQHVQKSQWTPELAQKEGVIPKDPTATVGDDKQLVAADQFRFDKGWWDPGRGIGAARTQPALLAALEPEARAGFGPLALAPKGRAGNAPAGRARPAAGGGGINASGANVVGKHWAVITAVAPLVKQSTEYYNTFRGCRFTDPYKDRPVYVEYFEVERAEVKSDDPNEKLEYQAINVPKAFKDAQDKWAAVAAEVVDPIAIDPALTFPLPPLVDRAWGHAVAHARIPILQTEEAVVEETNDDDADEDLDEDSGEEEEEELDEDADADEDAAPAGAAVGPAGGAAGAPGAAVGPAAGVGAAVAPGADPGAGAGIGAGAAVGRPAGIGSTKASDRVVDRLVRFFDFNVAPGKRYRYRIRLKLANPNYDVSERHLADSALAAEPELPTPWSEPTPVVQVPRGTYLLAGSVKAGQGANEPTAEVMIVQQDKKFGVNLAKPFKMFRGQLADFSDQDVMVLPPREKTPQKLEGVDLLSKSVLLDLKGGGLLPMPATGKKLREYEPAEVLFLDPDGRLVVHSELDQGEEFLEWKGKLDEWGATLNPTEEEEEEDNAFDRFIGKQGPGGSAPGAPGGGAPGAPGGGVPGGATPAAPRRNR